VSHANLLELAKKWMGKKMGGQKNGWAKIWVGKKMGGQKDWWDVI